MNLLDEIENKINPNLSIQEQAEVLKKFDNLTDSQIIELATFFKYSEAGILIEYLGFDRLQKHQEIFIIFLQDMNWPGAFGVANMFRNAGTKALPIVKKTLESVKNDDIWLDWILINIVGTWPSKIVKEIQPILEELVILGIGQGTAVRALRILKDNGLISKEYLKDKYNYLSNKFKNDRYALEDLQYEISIVENYP